MRLHIPGLRTEILVAIMITNRTVRQMSLRKIVNQTLLFITIKSIYEGGPRNTRSNGENTKVLGKNVFILQHNLLVALYTFPSDVQ